MWTVAHLETVDELCQSNIFLVPEDVNGLEVLVGAIAELETEEFAGIRGRATELDSQSGTKVS